MERKIRVGAVSYLNTKPLLYGIQHLAVRDELELHIDYPARIAAMLINDEIDIGLVPVAIIPKLKQYYINTDFCIGSDGPVASVCVFSEVPLAEISKILLDYQSRTSVQLARILLKEYWKISPELIDGGKDFLSLIGGSTAGVVIGDRALEQRQLSPYVYDLGEAWKSLTGLPFVFAAWVSNKVIDAGFMQRFNLANAFGLQNLGLVLDELYYPVFDLQQYYTKHIDYTLDERKRKGLALFLQKLTSV